MSKTAKLVRDNTVLLSLHDVSPQHENAVVESCDLLEDLGINSYTLLITPFLGMKAVNSFEKAPLFCEYLKSLGVEMALHGYSHRTKSGDMGEFMRMPAKQMSSRIRLASSLFKRYFGTAPAGFIPPGWIAPVGLVKIISDIGLRYCVLGNTIYLIETGNRLSTGQHVVSQGTPVVNLSNAMLEIEIGGSLQVALHPNDLKTSKMYHLIEDMMNRLDYGFMSYGDYLNSLRYP